MPPFGSAFVSMRPQPGGGHGFPVGPGMGVDRSGLLKLLFAPTSPFYVNAQGEIDLRTRFPLTVATGSPPALTGHIPTAEQVMDASGTTVADTQRRILTAIATINTTLASIDATFKARGSVALTAGAVTVATASVATGDLVFVSNIAPSGTYGFLAVQNIVDGVSFDIISTDATDTSTIAWQVVSP